MSSAFNQDEDKVRKQIRERLREQSERIQEELKALEERESKISQAQRIHKIVEEERETFYKNLGYIKVVEEDGSVEWMPPDRAQALEDKIGEELDDLEGGQRKVRWFFILWVSLSFLVVGLLLVFFWPNPGSIRVTSNPTGANIVFNNDTTSMVTDSVITDVETGHHILTVVKRGYRVKGVQFQQLELRRGEDAVLFFELEPAPEQPAEVRTEQRVTEVDTLYERLKQKQAAREVQIQTPAKVDTTKPTN